MGEANCLQKRKKKSQRKARLMSNFMEINKVSVMFYNTNLVNEMHKKAIMNNMLKG